MANKSRKGVKNRDRFSSVYSVNNVNSVNNVTSGTSGSSGSSVNSVNAVNAADPSKKQHGKKISPPVRWEESSSNVFPSEDSSSSVVSQASQNVILNESKKELSVKGTLQATSEQMMIAQLISHEEDPKHKVKIQNVMDITNKEEDEVATALFDCDWDESKAIEFLLDSNGGKDGFGEWEETGKKKKKNKQATEDKNAAASSTEDWDEHAGDHTNSNNTNINFNSHQQSDSNREKSRQRGPPRMRRGGSNAGGRGGSRGGGGSDRSAYNGNNMEAPSSAGEVEGGLPGHHYHPVGQRSRGAPPRRGGGRGGERGGRSSNYQPRYDRSNTGNPGGNSGGQGGVAQAFSGSIDTWNPSGDNSEQSSNNKKSRHNNKDAFDNAGNWGDDFPAAEDWDNEEYTGSLADTKVFTAKNTSGPKMPSAVGQNRGGGGAAAPTPSQSSQQTQPQGSSSSEAAPSSQQPSTYSQSIDLSTLLQKPTTQSSLTNPQNLLQFQQHASDSLKGVVGLSSTSSQSVSSSQAQGSNPGNSGGKGDLYYGGSSQQSGGSYSALIKSGSGPTKSPQVISNSKSRLPPPSKIPSSAVEMPGDSLTKLDVQFGGLDLQFGASTGDSSASGTNGGFDFGSSSNSGSSSSTGESSKYLSGSDKSKLDVYSSSAPSAKEVTKSLASKIDSSIGFDRSSKGSASSSNNNSASSYKTQEVINNFNSSSNPSYSSYPSQPGQQGSVQKQSSGKTYPPGANNNYNQFPQYSNQSNGSYANNGSQQAQPYTQANSGAYNAVNGGSSSSTSGSASNYPSSSSNVSTANYNNNYNSVSSSSSVQQSYGSSKGNSYEATSTSLKNDYPPSAASSSAMQNSLGVPGGSTATALGLTSTTNALSGKISATSASKVNLSNFPPGVASMLPTQYMIGNAQAGIPPFYGLQQHMYSTYNASTASGIEELAALQRGAAAAGLHTLVGSAATGGAPPPPVVGSTTSGPIAAQGQHSATGKVPTTGYYDPNSQFANSLAAATSGGSRADGNTSGSAGSNSINSLNDKNFGANSNSVGGNESTSSPIPSTLASAVAAATTPAAAQAAAQAAAAAQQQSFSLNTFAPQQTAIPAPYAYYFGPGLQAYGSGVYPAAPMNVVPTAAGGTASTQFQKTGYGSSYASAYENLGQQVNKEFNPTYSSGTGNNKVPAGGVAAGSSSTAPGKGGHQYWNSATNHLSSQLWG